MSTIKTSLLREDEQRSAATPPTLNILLDETVTSLQNIRKQWRSIQGRKEFINLALPSPSLLQQIIIHLKTALFPRRLGRIDLETHDEDNFVRQHLLSGLLDLQQQINLEIRHKAALADEYFNIAELKNKVDAILKDLLTQLPSIRSILEEDLLAALRGDPASKSTDEILLSYPGWNAIFHYRLAHFFYGHGLNIVARVIAELAHGDTGIDIHPGAQIGSGLFIDHGTGVVIGETAIIGKNVRIYQAVTLGAKRFTEDENGHLHKGQARHPIIENDVVIYAGATILGRVTIGRGSIIGGNVWLTHSVPEGSQISQAVTRNASPDEFFINGAGI
ncbi:serine O-acetyltransferase EpsC [Snodgrassella sp. CFCC 13594]|uniref:serine O-acetyltransferase EpsC n=1 Tax=Snodgrassella sp. CFCC 13594 TaxID=1775559 RepID=UPI00082958C6|nr:serine O-acetyltransferase EpsC [Snodgrassella sp. CFCC 13594]